MRVRLDWERSGYRLVAARACRMCGAPIKFWHREETGTTMPADAETGEPHWATCPKAELFRYSKNGKSRQDARQATIFPLDDPEVIPRRDRRREDG